ncbi:MAG: hypothetical protein H6Q10_1055 [Acidobacteria bacterium]|nr:hypothetical protein [Acidobacteriota bacterium]
MTLAALALAAALVLSPASSGAGEQAGVPQSDWQVFEGGWSASGQRQSLQTESGRPASTVYLSGAVVLTVGVARGFRGEVIGFEDGANLSVGRCVWTDEHGDRVFSTLTGETIGAGRRFTGTITGGTGRYAGITGEYTLEWQYVVDAELGAVQGRAVGLKGRYRAGGAAR